MATGKRRVEQQQQPACGERGERESRGMQVTLANAHMLALARRLDLHARIIRRSERPRLAADSRQRRGRLARAAAHATQQGSRAVGMEEKERGARTTAAAQSSLLYVPRARALTYFLRCCVLRWVVLNKHRCCGCCCGCSEARYRAPQRALFFVRRRSSGTFTCGPSSSGGARRGCSGEHRRTRW